MTANAQKREKFKTRWGLKRNLVACHGRSVSFKRELFMGLPDTEFLPFGIISTILCHIGEMRGDIAAHRHSRGGIRPGADNR
jgi:hypothetical protein